MFRRAMLATVAGAALVSGSVLAPGAAFAQKKLDEAPLLPAKAEEKPAGSVDLYAAPKPVDARARAIEAVAARGVKDQALLDEVAKLWDLSAEQPGEEKPSARQMLEKVVATAALVDPKAKEFVAACTLVDAPLLPPDPGFLDEAPADDFFAANLRLFYGRYLAQRRMYDEGLSVLSELDPKQVVDPATALFFRAVCEHQLLMKTEALATLARLTKNTEDVPPSYSSVATLMQYELESLNEKTLAHVSRKMQDSERRLDLGRVGERVQKVQDEIIADLDEIIEKMEQQAGGGGGGGGSGQNPANQSGSPAQDSVVKGAAAPGDADKKNLTQKGRWGDLDEKDTAKARNEIGRQYPSNYKTAVDAYFEKLARLKEGRK